MFQPCEYPQWIKGKSTRTAGAQRAEERKRRGSLILRFAPDATIRHGMPQDWLQYHGIQCNSGIFRLVRMGVRGIRQSALIQSERRGRRQGQFTDLVE